MHEITEQQDRARRFIKADLADAVGLIDDVRMLWGHSGLPDSPDFDAALDKARDALTEARRFLSWLTREPQSPKPPL